MKNICICGFGSIGKKHGLALTELGYRYDVIDVRYELSGRYDKEYDLVLICTPTAFHISEALKFINTKSFLIEKSFDSDLEKIINAKSFFKNKNVYVGYNLRYTTFYKDLIECIDQYGNNFKFINVVYQGYLNEWRPGVKPEDCYSYNKNLGGGIILDVSHEFDYIYNLFGKPKKADIFSYRVSNTTIDCDDYCLAIWEYNNFAVKFELQTFGGSKRSCQFIIEDPDNEKRVFYNEFKVLDSEIKKSYNYQLHSILNKEIEPWDYDKIIEFNELIMKGKI